MIDDEMLFILTNELSGQASEEEIERLNKWLHESRENEEACYKFRQAFINGKYTVEGKNSDLAFQKLSKKINFKESQAGPLKKRRDVRFFMRSQWLRNLAAIFIFLISTTFIFKYLNKIWSPDLETSQVGSSLIVKSNPRGQKSMIVLPDCSTVKLNSESYIEYKEDFSGGRQVKLVGEAFFNVVRDTLRPFVVKCSDMQIRVLGTSFNIQAYPFNESMSVAVESGTVRVENRYKNTNEQLAILSPNELIRIDHKTGELIQSKFDPVELLAWKEGIIAFKQASFNEIVEQLERWYDVDFILKRSTPGQRLGLP